MSEIGKRKDDHLDLAATGDVGFHRTTTLFEAIRFVHDALPELSMDEIDTSVSVLGKTLRAPILIAGMTGGTERAERINRELGALAEARGYAFGLGSQRAMHKDPSVAPTYAVREVAPNVLLLGNVGLVQATRMSTDEVAELVRAVGADALCLHLNPAQEAVQPGGDRDFRGGLETIARLVAELPVPVVVKETGCGISAGVARRLRAAGALHVDVSGAGGTSWVAVETQRSDPTRRALGETFWEWGIPTAASLGLCSGFGFQTVFATGGVATGLDVAKAVALGASAAGLARPVLKALESGGAEGASAFFERIEAELRTAMLLVGAKSLGLLRRAPRVVSPELSAWLTQAG
ncbi:MAG: type 2 isopentenyl-diphosphate Delta-isomerase [Polyangiaceae bacterium]|nr:type 2 isopentenyl-diphosphate Delta-isomerase [Polyangiaceae bacterium]MCL4753871.1 type 2 isopentenyl-diphosphate Delta-isomerase [Myxococcales bacterium]